MDFGEVWKMAQQAGPFGIALALFWGWTQHKRAELERAERIKLQDFISGPGGLLERCLKAVNDGTTAMSGMTDSVRPIVNILLEQVRAR